MKLARLTLACSVLPALAPLRAQADAGDAMRLPDYHVTGSPLASMPGADRFATTKSTISQDQLRDLAALDFASALRRTPGVTITRYNQVGAFGGGEGGAVFLRGMGASRPGGEIKTLVDGVPVLNGVFNHPLLDLMSVDAAARIEVHGRAAPLEFGNAFATVNVITPRVATPGTVARANLAAGSFGTLVERLDVGARTGAFDYYASQSYRRSDGHRPDSGGRMENYLLRLGWSPSPRWDLTYLVNRTNNRATDPGVMGAPAGPPSTRGETYETAHWLHIATLTYHAERAEGSLRAYLNDGKGHWLRRSFSGNPDSLNDWRLHGVRWRDTRQPWAGGSVVSGIDVDTNRGTTLSVPPGSAPTAAFGPVTLRLVSAYAGLNQAFTVAEGVSFTPSAGVRYYEHNVYGSSWAPQAGVTLTTGRTHWHAGFSRALNHPGLEVAAFSQVIIPALGQSWRSLGPETAHQAEVGLRHGFDDRTAVTVTVFRNQARDRYVIVPPPPPPPRYLNIASARTEGLEATVETRPARTLGVFAGVSLLRVTPAGLPYAPRHTLRGGLNWQFLPGWMLSADGAYASSMHVLSQGRQLGAANPQTVGAHFLLNARVSRRFVLGAGQKLHGEVYAAGENLTDRNFAYRPGYPIPGANGMVGVRIGW